MIQNYSKEDLSAGKDMILFAKDLFPLNRSLMGPDIKFSLQKFIEFALKTNYKIFPFQPHLYFLCILPDY